MKRGRRDGRILEMPPPGGTVDWRSPKAMAVQSMAAWLAARRSAVGAQELQRFSTKLSAIWQRTGRRGTTHPEAASAFSRHRRLPAACADRFFSAERDFSPLRGGRNGMDGEGQTSLANSSDPTIEEALVVDSKEVQQKETADAGGGKETEAESREGEWFHLTGSCSLVLHRGDITKWFKDGKSDAVVNAANERLRGGGGVDGAIHRAAGRELLNACQNLPEITKGVRCPVGHAVLTPGFKLPVAHVIHTVGPIYRGVRDPAKLLSEAYENSVNLAKENDLKYIAFPAISCGIYGYPYREAAEVSIQVLQKSAGELSEVHFVMFEPGSYDAWLAEAAHVLGRSPV